MATFRGNFPELLETRVRRVYFNQFRMIPTLYTQVAKSPDGPIKRIAEPGPTRARRGSVRWVWRQGH